MTKITSGSCCLLIKKVKALCTSKTLLHSDKLCSKILDVSGIEVLMLELSAIAMSHKDLQFINQTITKFIRKVKRFIWI